MVSVELVKFKQRANGLIYCIFDLLGFLLNNVLLLTVTYRGHGMVRIISEKLFCILETHLVQVFALREALIIGDPRPGRPSIDHE